MDSMIKTIILLAISPFLILILHALVSRYFSRYKPLVSRQVVCALCILAGNMPMVLLFWYFVISSMTNIWTETAPTIFYVIIVYNALGYSYFHMFNMSETARRIRILYELYKTGGLNTSALVKLYGVDNVLSVRVDRLISTGQIKKVDGRYILDGRLLYYSAKLLEFWGYILGSPLMKSSHGSKN